MPETRKLYCYIDETGQDTLGKLFVVAVIVTDERQRELEASLEGIEQSTRKKTKWMKTNDVVREAYINAIAREKLACSIYTKDFPNSKAGFDQLEVLAAAQALNLYRDANDIEKYKTTIIIDGQSKTVAARMGGEFRKLGVKTRKVIGMRDESSAAVRLADAIAGLVRESKEGRESYMKLKSKLKRAKILHEL